MWKNKSLQRPHVLFKSSKIFWMYVGRGGDGYHSRYYDLKQGQGNNNSHTHRPWTILAQENKTENPEIGLDTYETLVYDLTSYASGENTVLYNSVRKLISTWRKIKSLLQTVYQTDKRSKCKRQNYKANKRKKFNIFLTLGNK